MRLQNHVSARRSLQIRGLLLTAALMAVASRGALADTKRGVTTPLDALAGTAAIVEGSIKGFTYTFDPAAGPRTVATLSDVTTDFGSFRGSVLEIATLGGPINERQGLFIPELPRLTDGTRYLIFLNNIDWFFSPVVENYIFRIETAPSGADVLIAPSGHAVVRLSLGGNRVYAGSGGGHPSRFPHPDGQAQAARHRAEAPGHRHVEGRLPRHRRTSPGDCAAPGRIPHDSGQDARLEQGQHRRGNRAAAQRRALILQHRP